MATTVWDLLQARAIDAVRSGLDRDIAARQLLAAAGGNRRMALATRIRLAATAAWTPDVLETRRALALVDRAVAVADAGGFWHPAFSEPDTEQLAGHHSAP